MSEFDRNLHSHAVATTAMAIPTATHNLACDVGRRANVVRRPTADCQFRSRSYSLRANTVTVMSIGSANLLRAISGGVLSLMCAPRCRLMTQPDVSSVV